MKRRLTVLTAVLAAVVLTSCGAPGGLAPSQVASAPPSATEAGEPLATPTPAPTPSPTPSPEAEATSVATPRPTATGAQGPVLPPPTFPYPYEGAEEQPEPPAYPTVELPTGSSPDPSARYDFTMACPSEPVLMIVRGAGRGGFGFGGEPELLGCSPGSIVHILNVPGSQARIFSSQAWPDGELVRTPAGAPLSSRQADAIVAAATALQAPDAVLHVLGPCFEDGVVVLPGHELDCEYRSTGWADGLSNDEFVRGLSYRDGYAGYVTGMPY